MTFNILNQIIEENDIPKDVHLQSDSGWECSETEMDGVWYNRSTNTIIFTQDGDEYDNYADKADWECLFSSCGYVDLMNKKED